MVAVDDITAEEDYLDPLMATGYLLRVREPEHRILRTPARDVHIHFFEKSHAAVHRYRLRGDADDRALYEHTKRGLIARGFTDMNAYSDAKNEVVAAIMMRATSVRP